MIQPERIVTEYHWTDLVLNASSLQMLADLRLSAKKEEACSALFYGPPGTGKTLAAALIGKELQKDVMRIDVSKYIGETEKNLEQLFFLAGQNSWILFFDEADALFGKRTNVTDSHDRYANQVMPYFFRKYEKFKGIAILAMHTKPNKDDAFIRRLRYVIRFPLPEPPERLLLWEKALTKNNLSTASIDLNQIADKFKLTGGSIMNIVQKLREESSLQSGAATPGSVIDQLNKL